MVDVCAPDVTKTLARSRLGVFSVIGFALTAAAPLMAAGGVIVTGWAVIGSPIAFSLAVIGVGVILMIFSVGFTTMARHIVNAGSFYTYLARGVSRRLAVSLAMIQLVGYNLLQVGLYGIFGASAASLITAKFHHSEPWWAYALLAWIVVAVLGVLRVDLNSRILAVALVAEILVVAIFDIVDLSHPAGGRLSFDAFNPHFLPSGSLGAVLVTVATIFVGFEGGPTFSEESRHPRRTIPVATYLTLVTMVVFYAVTGWAMAATVGTGQLVAVAQKQGTDMIFNVAATHLGQSSIIVDVGHVLLLTSVFAGLLSYHSSVARASFALGRERVLPAAFGRTYARTGSPVVGSIAQSLIGLAVIIGYALSGVDPLVHLFFWLGMTGGLGVLILLTVTSVAVAGFFAQRPRGESLWRRLIAPLIAAGALSVVLYLALTNFASLLGVAPDSPLRWIFPSFYGVAALLGLAYGQLIATTRPTVYAGIGFGANAAANFDILPPLPTTGTPTTAGDPS